MPEPGTPVVLSGSDLVRAHGARGGLRAPSETGVTAFPRPRA